MEKKTSLFDNGLIWFGAGVSLAEILTGTYFSTLGFGRGLAAILLGHVIGCVLLFLAGVIGGNSRLSAMETGYRRSDHCMDHGRYHQSWKDQYRCNDSFVFTDTGTVQGDLFQWKQYSYRAG